MIEKDNDLITYFNDKKVLSDLLTTCPDINVTLTK